MFFDSIMAEIRQKLDLAKDKMDKNLSEKNSMLDTTELENSMKEPLLLNHSVSEPSKPLIEKSVQENKTTHSNEIKNTIPSLEDEIFFKTKFLKKALTESRKDYFDYLVNIVDDGQYYQELLKQKPSLIRNFIEYITGVIALWQDELKSEDSLEYADMYLEDIHRYESRISMAEEALKEMHNVRSREDASIPSTPSKKNILIFGSTEYPSKKILFQEDLEKDIPISFYEHVLDLLEGLQTEEKVVIESYRGDHLKGLKKVKKGTTGIRLIFRPLSSNMVYVDMILQKKCTNNFAYENQLASRKKLLNDDYEKVLAIVRSGQGLEELIEKNQKLLEEFKEYLLVRLGQKSSNIVTYFTPAMLQVEKKNASIRRLG